MDADKIQKLRDEFLKENTHRPASTGAPLWKQNPLTVWEWIEIEILDKTK